jgi:hypothetical protein
MNASELSVFLLLENFILSLPNVPASYEWGWRMHPMWGSSCGVSA